MNGSVKVVRHEIDYAPRRQFLGFHNRTQRWACLVCHRRAGKTVATVNDKLRRAIVERKPDARYAFIAPLRSQVKDIAWPMLKRFAQPLLGEPPNESELWVRLINGAQIRLYGGDNPDALRGTYLDGVTLDEIGDMRPSLWLDVIRPMLADRNGWATFIGTPKGKNFFHELWAGDGKERLGAVRDPEWFAMMLKASESGIINAAELADMRKAQGSDRYSAEMECSWEAAIHGAFYAEEMRAMEAEGRIRPIEIDPNVRVHTGWDLGRTDSTAIWFIQCVNRERRLVDYHEESGKVLTHYADVLYEKKRQHGWQYAEHFWPHDMGIHMLDAEKSRVDLMRQEGIAGTIVRQHDVLEGVNVVRKMLGRTWIDPNRCSRGIEALRQYRREFDERLKDWKPGEHKDWTNHGCDALRTFAAGFDDPMSLRELAPKYRSRQDSASGSSWTA